MKYDSNQVVVEGAKLATLKPIKWLAMPVKIIWSLLYTWQKNDSKSKMQSNFIVIIFWHSSLIKREICVYLLKLLPHVNLKILLQSNFGDVLNESTFWDTWGPSNGR